MMSILNYGSGNISAIATLAKLSNVEFEIIDTAEEIARASKILVPGVGAFDRTLGAFNERGLGPALKARIASGEASCIGVCVGMQILATRSDEGSEAGLGLIPGQVRRFDPASIPVKPKVPHMGWNSVTAIREHPLLAGIDLARGFYFLHGYYYECDDPADAIATSSHGQVFHSVIGRGRVFGVQFHPEKSHGNGVQLIRNFLTL
jgi:glutamine amidotransferase